MTLLSVDDGPWGCEHNHVAAGPSSANIFCCTVQVKDVKILATALSDRVVDTSWITSLDPGTQLQYKKTTEQTGAVLEKIFSKIVANPKVEKNFGELMVSMGACRSLGQLFQHTELPLAELWKSRLKQNDGFDFHTACPSNFIHFGEAKYSSIASPYSEALEQIASFLADEKHFRDRSYLRDLVSGAVLINLDAKNFGVVAAFSLNAKNPEKVMANAVERAIEFAKGKAIKNIFLVGVGQ